MQIGLLHGGIVPVLAKVAVKPSKDTVLFISCRAWGGEMRDAPGDSATILSVGERIGHVGPGGDWRERDCRFDMEIYAIRRELNGIVLESVVLRDSRDAALERE